MKYSFQNKTMKAFLSLSIRDSPGENVDFLAYIRIAHFYHTLGLDYYRIVFKFNVMLWLQKEMFHMEFWQYSL